MSRIDFITFNDLYNGIYQGQVIDVVQYLNDSFEVEVRLVAFVPFKLWLKQRKLIKGKLPGALVFPILGPLRFYKITRLWFRFYNKSQKGIARGPLAFDVCRDSYFTLIYDGRAAVKAEVQEYDITGSKILDQIFIEAEKRAVLQADSFISVSEKLVNYWEEIKQAPIDMKKVMLIPCTVMPKKFSFNELVYLKDEVTIVYAGGTAAWQSFDLICELLTNLLKRQDNVSIKFMTKPSEKITQMIADFPNRCKQIWCAPSRVYDELISCDYGVLIREDSVTNRVASPVKFAEYLNAGLAVLITENIGDFSEFVLEHKCGVVIKDKIPILQKPSQEDKMINHQLCEKYFTKTAIEIHKTYERLIKAN